MSFSWAASSVQQWDGAPQGCAAVVQLLNAPLINIQSPSLRCEGVKCAQLLARSLEIVIDIES